MSKAQCPHCHETIVVEITRREGKEMIQVMKPPPVANVNITASDNFKPGEGTG